MREGRYEHEAQSKPAPVSSSVIVTRAQDEVHFWRSVFGETADPLVRQWPELLGTLQSRVSPLETLFHDLEELSISVDIDPRRGMERRVSSRESARYCRQPVDQRSPHTRRAKAAG
jgi:hypothetical protein